MPRNYLQGNAKRPFHLSVGAIVFNDEGKIACHHVREFDGKPVEGYVMMRETIEPGESLESALARGLQEEFGIKAQPISYVGSVISKFDGLWHNIEKTTVYFLMEHDGPSEKGRYLNDKEVEGTNSVVEWHDPDFLIEQMNKQTEKYKRPDIDESKVIKAAVKMRQKA